jgi:predicted amidophosphoribosyltransferase
MSANSPRPKLCCRCKSRFAVVFNLLCGKCWDEVREEEYDRRVARERERWEATHVPAHED